MSDYGVTVNTVSRMTPFAVARIVTAVGAAGGTVRTRNRPVDRFFRTRATLGSRTICGWLDVSVTSVVAGTLLLNVNAPKAGRRA